MSEFSTRDLAEVGVKLIGVSLCAASLVGMAGAAAFLTTPLAGERSQAAFVFATVVPNVVECLVGAACLVSGRSIAQRYFASLPIRAVHLSRRDLLVVGLVLAGVGSITAALPSMVRFVGLIAWYADATRQAELRSALDREWQPVMNSVVKVSVGAALVFWADSVATIVERRRKTHRA